MFKEKKKKNSVTEQSIRKLMYPSVGKVAFPPCDIEKEELLVRASLVSGCCAPGHNHPNVRLKLHLVLQACVVSLL